MVRPRHALVFSSVAVACFSESSGDETPSTNADSTGAATSTGPSTSATSTSTTADTTADTSSDAATTTAEGTGSPSCGDGNVDLDEDCDDGNTTPGDGCSGCRPSGAPAWVTTVGTDGLRDECYGVALGEGVFAAGGLGDGVDLYHGWVERFERDGIASWRFDHEDDTSSGFRAVTLIDDDHLVAVGLHNNPALLIGDAWAKRFTTGGVSGPEEELSWQVESGSAGFVDVATLGDDLVLAGLVGVEGGYQSWYGQLPSSSFPAPTFTAQSYSGGMGVAAESFARGGAGADARVRATHRTLEGGAPDAIRLLGFDVAIVDPPTYAVDLEPSDEPVIVAVGADGRSFVCRTVAGGTYRDAQVMRMSPALELEDFGTVTLDGDVTCDAIVAVDDRVVIAGGKDGALPFVAELDADLALVWSSALDGGQGRVRSIALDAAGDAVAVCGTREDGIGAPTTDALVGLIVR